MRVLFFAPPFYGHSEVFRKSCQELREFEAQILITGWQNRTLPDFPNICADATDETDPILWSFPRVAQNLRRCEQEVRRFKPDLIIYDFFSLEGLFVAKKLGIRHWCSIPTLLDREQLDYDRIEQLNKANRQPEKALIEDYLGEAFFVSEYVSDGIFLGGQENIVWSYPEVYGSSTSHSMAGLRFHFVGVPNQTVFSKHEKERKKIFVSFGTVIMGNLWDSNPMFREIVSLVIEALIERFPNETFVFASMGRGVRDHYPDNWEVVDWVDQDKVLSESKAFITHGGCNSFHQSLQHQVPMVVIPLFADQGAVARKILDLDLGLSPLPQSRLYNRSVNSDLDFSLVEMIENLVTCLETVSKRRDWKWPKINDHLGLKNMIGSQFLDSKTRNRQVFR